MISTYIILWFVQVGFAMEPPPVLQVFQNIRRDIYFETNFGYSWPLVSQTVGQPPPPGALWSSQVLSPLAVYTYI
jgi:hypothetical protein